MKFIFSTLFLLIAVYSFSQKNEQSILNKRFYITVPDSAKNIARAGDIMGPNPNENKETRIIYDEGDERLVFFARELNVKSTTNLAETVRKESSPKFPFEVTEFSADKSLKMLLITPKLFDSTKNAILIAGLLIQNADSTLSKFDAYINPAAFKEKKRFSEIVQHSFSTIRPGERRVNLDAHTDTFNIMGSKTRLQIKLPENYITQVSQGTDFEVYNINKIAAYGSVEDNSLVVYFGFYPSLFVREYNMEDFKTAQSNSEFMLHSQQWDNYYDAKSQLFLREQIFEDDEIGKGMKIHIAITSNSQKGIDEMAGIVKNLLLVYNISKAQR